MASDPPAAFPPRATGSGLKLPLRSDEKDTDAGELTAERISMGVARPLRGDAAWLEVGDAVLLLTREAQSERRGEVLRGDG